MKFARTFVCIVVLVGAVVAAAQGIPNGVSNQEFWRMVSQFSESGGQFQAEFMSNEDSAQFVIPDLKVKARQSGVYVGVGPEQNFTYIAAVQPRLAFVVDIRRDNLIEHLMYKAIFELASDRADFVSRLFSRKRPPGLDTTTTVKSLFDAYQTIEPDSRFYQENVLAVISQLVEIHKFPLSEVDKDGVARMMNTFRAAGPYALTGSGDKNVSYAQMMSATDLAGSSQSYLASEQNFTKVQEAEKRNVVIPIVGDFAGDKALRSIGQYLRERNAVVNVFYVSNVERYLFEQGDHGKQFYANASSLPSDQASLFIRSVTVDISRRLGIPVPDAPANWRSFLVPMNDCLKAFEAGKIRTYRDLF